MSISEVGPEPLSGHAIVEFMGHTRMAGRIGEEDRFGARVGRLDVPGERGTVTVYFSAASVFRVTMCTEAAARIVAFNNPIDPISFYDLPVEWRTAIREQGQELPLSGGGSDGGADWSGEMDPIGDLRRQMRRDGLIPDPEDESGRRAADHDEILSAPDPLYDAIVGGEAEIGYLSDTVESPPWDEDDDR